MDASKPSRKPQARNASAPKIKAAKELRADDNMDTIGHTLREARHAKMATLEDASRATRVKLEILERLEADEFDQLAAPMYTKGFLRMYADYLGLDSQTIVDAYLKSQGGLRRQGLQVETGAAFRARKPSELQLPIMGVVRIVAALTIAVILGLVIHYFVTRRSPSTTSTQVPAQAAQPAPVPAIKAAAAPAQPAPVVLPKADFEAYYQPKIKPSPELLDPSGK